MKNFNIFREEILRGLRNKIQIQEETKKQQEELEFEREIDNFNDFNLDELKD